MHQPAPAGDDEPFAALLRRHRLAAELTQANLAERANLSERGISDLERAIIHVPQQETLHRLVAALNLIGPDLVAFETAARRQPHPSHASHSHHASANNARSRALPQPPTVLIGRDAELAALLALLRRPEHRLITLVGAGGAGKTRLALAAAHALTPSLPSSVHVISLASTTDSNHALDAIAQSLDIRKAHDQSLLANLIEHIADHRIVLVLDNLEQVPIAPTLATLLGACPNLTLLTTSRVPLRLQAERLFPVPPLSLFPSPSLPLSPSPAVALFVARAAAVRSGFALTRANVAQVVAICHELDGLPLAIELAAARCRHLNPGSLLARLTSRLALLVDGPHDLPERQQTLRATLTWSHDLLSPPLQILFRRLAVFAGGFTLTAADSVVGGEGDGRRGGGNTLVSPSPSLPLSPSVFDGLSSLIDHNLLIHADNQDSTPRFAMLATVREFATECLARSDEESTLRDRHAIYAADLASTANNALSGPEQGAWLDRLDAELANLRAALAWATRPHAAADDPPVLPSAPETGLHIAGSLWAFWRARGHIVEGISWLERAIAHGPTTPSLPRATALTTLGILVSDRGDFARTRHLYEESLAISRAIGDARGTADTLNNLGLLASYAGDYPTARALQNEALAIRRDLSDGPRIVASLSNLGDIANNLGNHTQATALHTEALALAQKIGDIGGEAYARNNLGEAALSAGDTTTAATWLNQSLDTFTRIGDEIGLAYALHNLGAVAAIAGDPATAAARYLAALDLWRESGHRRGITRCLEALASLLASTHPEDATRLLGATTALRSSLGAALPPIAQNRLARTLASTRAALPASTWCHTWQSGHLLTFTRAIDTARNLAPVLTTLPTQSP